MLELQPEHAGLLLVDRLPLSAQNHAPSQAAYARSRRNLPLSAAYLGPANARALLLGYPAYANAEIRAAMRRLAQALRDRS